jgi:hypothetical protein
VLRNKLLRSQGWHVIDIPYFEWNALRSPNDRIKYLRARIALEVQNREEFLSSLDRPMAAVSA